MIKVHGLCKLASKAVHALESEEELVGSEQEVEIYDIRKETPIEDGNSWYENVRQCLEHDTIPSQFSIKQKRELRLKALAYHLVHGVLYRKHNNRVLLRFLEAHESKKVLQDLHDRSTRDHFPRNTTAHKVMRASFYWPTLFKDAHAYTHKCLVYQWCTDKARRIATPLHLAVVVESFQQWGLDVIGEIFPHSSKEHHYILTTIDYFMWWSEVVPLKQVNDQELINFHQQKIISRFGVLVSLVFYKAMYFSSLKFYDFSLQHGIVLK